MDFDYKKYSLEQLDNWMHDALSSAEATPQEIYDVIKGVVEEQYVYFKEQANRCNQLLTLLNNDRNYRIPVYDEFRGSTVSSVQYTEEELNAMCDKAASDREKEQCREYNLREAEYYDKRAKLDMNYQEAVAAGWEMTADGFWIREDKVKKWLLPVEIDPSGEYFVSFPDDLLEAANLEESDQVEWVDNGDGSYTLKKVWKDPYKEEMLAAGYKMIDGRWQHSELKSDEC